MPNSNDTIIGPNEIRSLKVSASKAPLRRARTCMHPSDEDLIQEMVIAICDDCYIGPHRQNGKTKSYVILEGKLTVVFFDEAGNLSRYIEMEQPGTGGCCVLRFDSSEWHTVVCSSPHAVYMETITGPYIPDQTDWAPWAPCATDTAGIIAFRDVLNVQISD